MSPSSQLTPQKPQEITPEVVAEHGITPDEYQTRAPGQALVLHGGPVTR